MGTENITVTPCTPHVGAEIGGIDLTKPLSERERKQVYDAFLRHGVIFFREQDIGFEDQMRLAGYFGHVHIHVGGEGTASKPAMRELRWMASGFNRLTASAQTASRSGR